MTEEDQEEYLRKNGWRKITEILWFHNNCRYFCCIEVAFDVQKLRDREND